ncbi:MAG: PilZ domain-containing protein [Myxococcales bacterium]|nr:PilZ domain-containing protein [Myxococcales bacterium]MCB9715691.1 PilZ domain-containing protein [Myxococcales bacterium]
MAERRTHRRYDVWFPVQVDAGQLGTAVGISKDASAKGLRLDANADVIIGAPVRLRFRVSPHERPQDVDGTIVRVHRNRLEDSDWPYQLAVEFDDPEPTLDHRLATEASHQHPSASA